MVKMRDDGIESVEPTARAEAEWTDLVRTAHQAWLVRDTRSWYDGSNIPGKTQEPLIFFWGGSHVSGTVLQDAPGRLARFRGQIQT
ncbi:hypothetical protein E4U42_007269 [Claviceps africana]|uniref:Uncharacterized protein n=1 Tax=Claviceps africana TaxID=83212 RepID=A0A8K0NEN4_9HYPO|nr:hypothetical protein E4U42_007269 [Claviceps africana]